MYNKRDAPHLSFKPSSREKLVKLLRAKSRLLFFSECTHAFTHSLTHSLTRVH